MVELWQFYILISFLVTCLHWILMSERRLSFSLKIEALISFRKDLLSRIDTLVPGFFFFEKHEKGFGMSDTCRFRGSWFWCESFFIKVARWSLILMVRFWTMFITSKCGIKRSRAVHSWNRFPFPGNRRSLICRACLARAFVDRDLDAWLSLRSPPPFLGILGPGRRKRSMDRTDKMVEI